MLNVKLTKIESNHNKLRTNEIVGKTGSIPEKDQDIVIFSDPLAEGMSFRVIQTTVIQESNYDKSTRIFTFKTLNSTYLLEILDKHLSDEEIFSHGKYKP